jgi:type IV pilus assembly protein PilA
MSLVERCRQRHLGNEGEDEGFTLIELLVVLLIIGILLAIAIPTFLSVTKGANGTAAQSNLTNALTGAKTYYTDSNQSYIGILSGNGTSGPNSTSSLSQIGTGLQFLSGSAANGGHTVSITTNATGTNAGTELLLAAWAPGQNDCWEIYDNTSGANQTAWKGFTPTGSFTGTYYGVIRSTTQTACNASLGTALTAVSTSAFPSS